MTADIILMIRIDTYAFAGSLASARLPLSTARPMACSPLSTCSTVPVIADASGLSRNAAALPTSEACSSFCCGAFSYEYLKEHTSDRNASYSMA